MSFLNLFRRVTPPSTPAAGKGTVFLNTDFELAIVDANGVIRTLAGLAKSSPSYIRNGGFWFAQRQPPATATTYSSTTTRVITADGWGLVNENASSTYQRTDTTNASETGLQSRYYGNFLKITTTGKLLISQVIAADDAQQLRGRTVRFQAHMKQLVGASPVVNMAVLAWTGTADATLGTFATAFGANGVNPTLGTSLAYIAPNAGSATTDSGTVDAAKASFTLTSAWARYGATFTIPTTANNIVLLIWGNNQFAATNGFAVSQAILADGQGNPDWRPLPYDLELSKVRRFYQKSFATDTSPAQNAGATTGAQLAIAGKASAVAFAGVWHIDYMPPMRIAASTLTLFNPSAANAQARRGLADQTATTTANSTQKGFEITCTGDGAGTVGDQILVHWSADCEIL